jgi:hypothetical protein
MKEESQLVHKCKFCNSDATSENRFFVGTNPEKAEDFVKWDYFGEAVYTCDNHSISHSRCNMNGEPLDTTFF